MSNWERREIMKWGLLEFQESEEPGIQQVSLNIRKLLGNARNPARSEFEKRLHLFRNSSKYTYDIYSRKDELLIYQTETIIPKERKRQRTPLLLLLGNPASHSMKEKMFFSFERNRQEHRFWKVLDKSGIFPFKSQAEDLDKRNQLRKQKLLDVNYESPFCIGLTTFYSMPSPATCKWSGVAGIKRLLGKSCLEQITKWEKERIADLIKKFVAPNGIIIAFQKDACACVKDRCQCYPGIDVYCFPPTRLMYSNLKQLEELRKKYAKSD